MEPVLELKNISKRFPGVQALEDVSFAVYPGEIHALLGENGAGKSTLIKIASGVHQADEGEILVDQRPVRFHSPNDAQAHGIGAIYQELLLYPELTVAENIFMGHSPRNNFGAISWSAMREQALELLASLNITDLDVTCKVGTLSVGNRQRVEIAKALSLDARVLIMDEPTAALTESDVERLFSIMIHLKERGVGIIYISHRLQEVFEMGDRVTVLRDGKYIDTKRISETTEDELISMMVGRTIENLFPKLDAKIGEVVLEVRNLTHKSLVHDISFQLRAGEIVGLAGLIGAGRSELAHVLFGFTPLSGQMRWWEVLKQRFGLGYFRNLTSHSSQRTDTGEIWISGKRIRIGNPRQAMRHGIAYLPEDRGTQGLIREMNLRENTSLTVLPSLSRGTFINRQKEMALAQHTIVQLSIRAYSPQQIVGKLSGGNQQKVVVGKWLATKPKVLIVDEPTRGIDVGAKAEIHRLLSELAQQGMAILMISSELPEIMGMSDRVLVMREGRIVAELSRDDATQKDIGIAMMGHINYLESQMESA
jgi:rhamnose transport system ATP-binding protein